MESIEIMTISNDVPMICETSNGSVDVHWSAGMFSARDVLEVFNVNFLDYEFARMWVLKRLHPDGTHCPGCGIPPLSNEFMQRFWQGKRMRCPQCGKYFTALTGTFLSGCHLDFRGVILLAVLLALGIHDKQIAAIVEMSSENVRLWRKKFQVQERLASSEVL